MEMRIWNGVRRVANHLSVCKQDMQGMRVHVTARWGVGCEGAGRVCEFS